MIQSSAAGGYIGQEVTIEGHVDAVVCSGQACLLSFEQGFSGLVASIAGDRRSRFPDPRKTYQDRTVRIRGKIEERDGRPRMQLSDPKRIELVKQAPGVRSARSIDGGASDGSSPSDVTMPPAPAGPAAAPAPPTEAAPIVAKGLDGRSKVVTVTQQPAAAPGEGLAGIRAALEQEELTAGASAPATQPPPPPPIVRGGAAPRPQVDPAAAGVLPLKDDQGPASGEAPYDEAVAAEVAALKDQVALLEQGILELNQRLSTLESNRGGAGPAGAQAGGVGDGGYAANTGSGVLPSLPAYIVPETTSSRLRRVKRGWTANQVLKVLGKPAEVVSTNRGISTWNYGLGRSVTIDERGRVVSSIGF